MLTRDEQLRAHEFVGGYEIDPSRPNKCQVCRLPKSEHVATVRETTERIAELEQQRDTLLASLKEMRTACAAAMCVLCPDAKACEEWEALLQRAGIADGIGVRADRAIRAAEGLAAPSPAPSGTLAGLL